MSGKSPAFFKSFKQILLGAFFCALTLFASQNAFAAGYSCAKCYTSCKAGYARCSGTTDTGGVNCSSTTYTSGASTSCYKCAPCLSGYSQTSSSYTGTTCTASSYTMTFSCTGTSVAGTAPSSGTKTNGTTYTLPTNNYTCTKSLSKQIGWATSTNQTTATTSFTTNAAQTFYPVFSACTACSSTTANCGTSGVSSNVCTYTGATCKANYFNLSSGTTASPSCSSCPSNSSTANTNSASSCTCSTGYSTTGKKAGATTTSSTACSAIDDYSISYTLNSGTQATSNVPTTYKYGVGATISGVPTRSGYTFAGWCTDSGLTSCAMSQTVATTATGDKTFYAKWTQCTACSAGTGASCTLSVVNNVCTYATSCQTNYVLTSGSGTATPICTTCAAGQYWNGTACANVTAGYYSPANSPYRWACPSGYTTSGSGTTSDAITDCYKDESLSTLGQSTYCSAGVRRSTISGTSGLTQGSLSSYTYAAWTGTITSGTNMTYSASTSFQAKAGSYVSGYTCAQCAAGSFTTSAGTQTSCTVCAAGSYNTTTGLSSCTACTAGKTTTGTTAADHSASSKCSVDCGNSGNANGTYASVSWSDNSVSGLCTLASCKKGNRFSGSGTTTACTVCSAGTFLPSDNHTTTTCTSCANGSYNTTTGQSSCTACGAGKTNSGTGNNAACTTNCSNATNASGWTAASWSNNTTSNLCTISTCAAGYYTSSNACACVGADYYSAATSGTRTSCASNTKTSGCGTGAAASTDCKAYKVIVNSRNSTRTILRAIKTAPASRNFAVKVGDTVYYGNLSTNTKTGAVRLNVGGTTYYLNDNDYLNQ